MGSCDSLSDPMLRLFHLLGNRILFRTQPRSLPPPVQPAITASRNGNLSVRAKRRGSHSFCLVPSVRAGTRTCTDQRHCRANFPEALERKAAQQGFNSILVEDGHPLRAHIPGGASGTCRNRNPPVRMPPGQLSGTLLRAVVVQYSPIEMERSRLLKSEIADHPDGFHRRL